MFDYLRLALALEVVTYHLGVHLMGVDAVPAFLAISGFVILQSWIATGNCWRFWWKRIVRLQPAFIVMLIVTGLVLGRQYAVDTLHIYMRAWFGGYDSGNGATWSLMAEEIAYLSMAALYALGAYRSKPLIAAMFAAALVGLFFVETLTPHPSNRIISYLTLAATFFLGNLAYLHRDKVVPFARRYAVFSLPLLILGPVTVRLLAMAQSGPRGTVITELCSIGSITLTFAGIAAVLLVGLGVRIPSIKRDLSYSVYLWHVPLIFLLGHHFRGSVVTLITIVTLPILAVLSHRLVERPALRFKEWTPKWRNLPFTRPSLPPLGPDGADV
jgi:peptidoglycan/LPS O-acetylase OafA/YrhL